MGQRIKKIIIPISIEDMDKAFWCRVRNSISDSYKIRTIFCFLFLTGLRIKELVKLREENFIFRNGELTLNIPGLDCNRTFFLTTWFRNRLLKYKEVYNFEPTNFFRISKSKMSDVFAKLKNDGVRIRGQIVSPQLFRDSFAYNCFKTGMQLRELQHLLNFRNIQHTKDYIRRMYKCDPDVVDMGAHI